MNEESGPAGIRRGTAAGPQRQPGAAQRTRPEPGLIQGYRGEMLMAAFVVVVEESKQISNNVTDQKRDAVHSHTKERVNEDGPIKFQFLSQEA